MLKYTDPETGQNFEYQESPISLAVKLSDVRYEHERARYTFLEALSDFGGFNDGVLLLASGLTSSYAALMFSSSFSSKFQMQL